MATVAALRAPRWEHPEPGTKKSFLFSLAAHSVLVLMFVIGLNWKTSSSPTGVEVELWDNPSAPVIEPAPPEKMSPVVDEKADIVVEKKKVEPKITPPKKVDPKPTPPPKVEDKVKPKVEVKPPVKPKPEAPKEKTPAKTPVVNAQQAAAEEAERADRIAKMQADAKAESGSMGGTVGSGSGTGGVSPAGYADKVRRAIKPRIVYRNAAQVEGNPAASVLVELAPDGRILQRRLSKSSGIADWDAAVLRAIDETAVLPRDEDGSVPKSMVIIFRPKD